MRGEALNDKGYNAGPVDGKAGPKTKTALKQFQQSQGISASGQLDGQTLAALGVGATSSMQSPSDTQGSQSTSSNGSSQPPSTAPSDQQASNQQPSSAPSLSSTSKY